MPTYRKLSFWADLREVGTNSMLLQNHFPNSGRISRIPVERRFRKFRNKLENKKKEKLALEKENCFIDKPVWTHILQEEQHSKSDSSQDCSTVGFCLTLERKYALGIMTAPRSGGNPFSSGLLLVLVEHGFMREQTAQWGLLMEESRLNLTSSSYAVGLMAYCKVRPDNSFKFESPYANERMKWN